MLCAIELGGCKGTRIGIDPSTSLYCAILVSLALGAISSMSSGKREWTYALFPLFMEIKSASLAVNVQVVTLLLKAE